MVELVSSKDNYTHLFSDRFWLLRMQISFRTGQGTLSQLVFIMNYLRQQRDPDIHPQLACLDRFVHRQYYLTGDCGVLNKTNILFLMHTNQTLKDKKWQVCPTFAPARWR